jgi:hypothetical protein
MSQNAMYEDSGGCSFTTVIAYAWLFVSVVAGLANLVQYLYRHLQWV